MYLVIGYLKYNKLLVGLPGLAGSPDLGFGFP